MSTTVHHYLRLWQSVWQHSPDDSRWQDVTDEMVELRIEADVEWVTLSIRNLSGRRFHDLTIEGSAGNGYRWDDGVEPGAEVEHGWDVRSLQARQSWEWSVTGHFDGDIPLPPMIRPRLPRLTELPELPDPSFKITRKGS